MQRQVGPPNVVGGLAPQLHGAAGPPVLLLAVREEGCRQLRQQKQRKTSETGLGHISQVVGDGEGWEQHRAGCPYLPLLCAAAMCRQSSPGRSPPAARPPSRGGSRQPCERTVVTAATLETTRFQTNAPRSGRWCPPGRWRASRQRTSAATGPCPPQSCGCSSRRCCRCTSCACTARCAHQHIFQLDTEMTGDNFDVARCGLTSTQSQGSCWREVRRLGCAIVCNNRFQALNSLTRRRRCH